MKLHWLCPAARTRPHHGRHIRISSNYTADVPWCNCAFDQLSLTLYVNMNLQNNISQEDSKLRGIFVKRIWIRIESVFEFTWQIEYNSDVI